MKLLKYWIIATCAAALLSGCNNFFHDLVPPNGDSITSFEISGQRGDAVIGDNEISLTASAGTDIHAVVPRVTVSEGATLIPVTLDYVRAAFPSADLTKEAINLYMTNDLPEYVRDLIARNPDFNVPAIDIPIDFSSPVIFFVISGQGNIRRYDVTVKADTGLPVLSGLRFSKYDNPELVSDAVCYIDEANKTIAALAMYPAEMENLSYSLVPSFEIMGDFVEIDSTRLVSGETPVQFIPGLGPQSKTVTVSRGGITTNYSLAITFAEDPDTVRSITDFRFTKAKNTGLEFNAVASIVNNDNTGTITVQVFYEGAKPVFLVPNFVTPGTVSVDNTVQTSGETGQNFSTEKVYRVLSRNGMYARNYTVKTEFFSITNDAPRITGFRFSQGINTELVRDTEGEIGDGLIMIDIHYSGSEPPETLIPEFSAEGIVTVYSSVQVSGASGHNFSRQIKYTVTNPKNALLKRDYWVQARLVRNTSSDASITAFGFYPEENPGLADNLEAQIDQGTGRINVYAPIGSGVASRAMYPRFTAEGRVSVEGITQTSGVSGIEFDSPITYTVVSANGENSREYVVTVRELTSRIYVNQNAAGTNDGTSWTDAFISLKAACEAAALFPEDAPKEIWIAAGTYLPGANSEDYFPLTPNTSYLGGFAGGETSASQRNAAANRVTVSGELGGGTRSWNLFRLLDSGAGNTTINGNLVFDGISFNGARSTDYSYLGVAIYALLVGNEISITNCTFTGFETSNAVVYINGSKETINNCAFEQNKADHNLWISGSEYANIDGLSLREIDGGGIMIYYPEGDILLSNINANEVTENAIWISSAENSSITLRDSIFNSCGSVDIQANYESQINIINTQALNSVASSYDSVISVVAYNDDTSNPTAGSVTIDGLTIDGSASRGILISAYEGYSVKVINSVIKNTSHDNTGGGIYAIISGDLLIENTVIENCQAGNGGGIYANISGDLLIENTVIENCQAGSGGGIYILNPKTRISGTTIKNCKSTDWGGGGILYQGSDLIIENTTIDNCETTRVGGGIATWMQGERGIFKLFGVSITNCKADIGGGINFFPQGSDTPCPIVIEESVFENCIAIDRGGAFYLQYSDFLGNVNNLTITKTDFINCITPAPNSTGGIINIWHTSPHAVTPFVNECTFTYNKTDSMYQGLYMFYLVGNAIFDNCDFTNRASSGDCKEYFFRGNTESGKTFTNCTFTSVP